MVKTRDLTIVGLLYILGFVVAYVVYRLHLSEDLIFNLLIADIAMTVFIFLWSLVLKNASLYDPYWSVIPPVFFIFVWIEKGLVLNLGIFLVLFAMLFWSFRLTLNWIKGWHGFDQIDWRYQMLKEKAPKLYPLTNLFGIELFPTLIVFIQIIIGIKIIEGYQSLNSLVVIGFLMMVVAVIIEYVADEQMRSFKLKRSGKMIDEGLWSFSRHPNYFGEILFWWGLYVIYVGVYNVVDVWGVAPLLMSLMFVFISIPMMEKRILDKYPEYAYYQAHVSMLIPMVRHKDQEKLDVES